MKAHGLVVQTGQGIVQALEIQVEGRKHARITTIPCHGPSTNHTCEGKVAIGRVIESNKINILNTRDTWRKRKGFIRENALILLQKRQRGLGGWGWSLLRMEASPGWKPAAMDGTGSGLQAKSWERENQHPTMEGPRVWILNLAAVPTPRNLKYSVFKIVLLHSLGQSFLTCGARDHRRTRCLLKIQIIWFPSWIDCIGISRQWSPQICIFNQLLGNSKIH